MKKTMLLLAAVAATASMADEPVDWCLRWQQTRCPPIPYRSSVSNPQVAALVDAAQAVPAVTGTIDNLQEMRSPPGSK